MGREATSIRVARFGGFELDATRRTLRRDGTLVPLGSRAFDILLRLVEAKGELVTKDELVAAAWPQTAVEESNLRVQIVALRRALERESGDECPIITVGGRGYRLGSTVALVAALDSSEMAAPPPSQLTRLIGRQDTINEICDRLARGRFVTVTGAGGVGKTSLAIAVAERMAESMADGVCFLEFEPSDRGAPGAALATKLGLVAGGGGVDALANFLTFRSMLIVFDCCEHAVDAVAALAEDLLRRAPEIRLLATSREALRAAGEVVYPLGPLPVPDTNEIGVSDALQYPAVELFIDRIEALDPGFLLTAETVPLAVEICRRVDGVALAIELAAARVTGFGLTGVAERLKHLPQLLVGGRRTAPARHQTLRATLDWSASTLSEAEREALFILSVFAGPFTVEEATVVLNLDQDAAADAILALLAKSLVQANTRIARTEYRLLDTTRAYAQEGLLASGGARAAQHRHAAHYLEVIRAEAMRLAEMHAPSQPSSRYFDNARAAIDWAFSDEGDVRIAVELVIATSSLWQYFPMADESCARVRQALATLDRHDDRTKRQRMQLNAALASGLLLSTGASPEMSEAWEETLVLATQLGDAEYQARGSYGRVLNGVSTFDFHAAREAAERFAVAAADAGPHARALGDRFLGNAHHIGGDQASACAAFERFLTASPRPGRRADTVNFVFDQRVVALATFARALWMRGSPDSALATAAEAVREAEAISHAASLFFALAYGACPVALWCGDRDNCLSEVGRLREHSRRHPGWMVWARVLEAITKMRFAECADGIADIGDALSRLPPGAFNMTWLDYQAELASGLIAVGSTRRAMLTISAAIEHAEASGNVARLAEFHRLRGDSLLAMSGETPEVAEAAYHQALSLARSQGALSWELRAAVSLGRLWRERGRLHQAEELVGTVLGRFNEGLETADFLKAKGFLEGATAAEIRTF
jgi:predicted ATPase/DNA-binding winged helix-turn-helix (wHTH) protein